MHHEKQMTTSVLKILSLMKTLMTLKTFIPTISVYSQLVQDCLRSNQFDILLFEYHLKLDWYQSLGWINVQLFALVTKKPIQSRLLPEGQK